MYLRALHGKEKAWGPEHTSTLDRFSDEIHFSLGPQGKLMIIRRPGERYCEKCI
jgi:hypothetical protein